MIAAAMPEDVVVLQSMVNGQPGLAMQQGGVTVTVLAFDIGADGIKRIWAIRNPDKLRYWVDAAR
jgi:RNA polymerase sigma-70 factor (ECF subfamily)